MGIGKLRGVTAAPKNEKNGSDQISSEFDKQPQPSPEVPKKSNAGLGFSTLRL